VAIQLGRGFLRAGSGFSLVHALLACAACSLVHALLAALCMRCFQPCACAACACAACSSAWWHDAKVGPQPQHTKASLSQTQTHAQPKAPPESQHVALPIHCARLISIACSSRPRHTHPTSNHCSSQPCPL